MQTSLAKRPPDREALAVELPTTVYITPAPIDYARTYSKRYAEMHEPLQLFAERFLAPDDALDAVQDAMTSIWMRWPALVREKATDRYFYGAVHKRVLSVLDEQRRHVSFVDAEAELERQVVREYADAERADVRAEVVDAVVALMPPRRREAFLLVMEEGFTFKEAARILELSFETVKTHMRLANEDVRAALTRAGLSLKTPQPPRLSAPKEGDSND